MTFKKLLLALAVFTGVCNVAQAQQPFGGCWHPDYVINWSPDKDPDAKFNRSTVALQPRFTDGVKANEYQFADAQVSAALTMNPMCSQTPSQGADNFIGYNPISWQYMDLLIWWGGSAGEGIVIPPSAPVTDVAHMNGVKVLGQLFFPPTAFGGQSKWVSEMLTKEGNTYPYAKKMFEIAQYYGFDGWFINEETNHGAQYSEWVNWIAYFNQCAAEAGCEHMCIQWYDNGRGIEGKEDLMKLHNTSYFLDYGCTMNGNVNVQMNKMQDLGFSKQEAFNKVFFGINIASGGLKGNKYNWGQLYGQKEQFGSVDLFNPEEAIWKKTVESLLNTENACGKQAYTAMNKVFQNESQFWTNPQADPSNTKELTSGYWPGFANTILERSVIDEIPFITSFSAGLGKHRFVNGEKKGTQDWYHRGMQDILPTWRWWVAEGKRSDLNINFNWDDAYNMGTSVKIDGTLSSEYQLNLFKTKLSVKNGDKFQLVYKGTAPTIQLMAGVAENDNAFTTIDLQNAGNSNGWTIATADLSSLKGKTISTLALKLKGNGACDFLLGQLAVLPNNYSPVAPAVTNLKIQNKLKQEGGDIRAIWDAPESSDIHHYNVYITRNGERTLVGQTRNEGFYVSKFKRTSPAETEVKLEVVSVGNDLKEGNTIATTISYPEVTKPNVTIIASKTLVKKNEVITLTAYADNYPKTYKWTKPAGATIVSGEGTKEISIRFGNEGLYDITVAVSNEKGETVATEDGLVYVSDKKANDLKNVAKGKTIHSHSGALDPEVPENLIDGDRCPGDIHGKWCIGGKKEHWVIIDLEQAYQIYQFKTFDCGMKENPADNVKNYKIWVSDDPENWGEPVVNATNRPETEKEDNIRPAVGRYVKFMPYDNDSPITIRIWEFEVYALEGGPAFNVPESASLKTGEVKNLKFTYDLRGEAKAADFAVNVTSSKEDVVTIANKNVDEAKSEISFDLQAQNISGLAEVKVELINDGWIIAKKVKVEVMDASYVNVLAGKEVTINYTEFEEPTEITTKKLTDNNEETFENMSADGLYQYTVDCGEEHKFVKAVLKAQQTANLVKFEVSKNGEVGSFVEVANMKGGKETTFSMELDPTAAVGRYIRFTVECTEYEDFNVTEIEAYGKATGVGIDANEVKASVYPTLFDNTLVVNGEEGAKVVVSNIAGMQVYSAVLNGETTIATSNWASGVYFVTVGNQVVKVIRK